MKSARLDIKQRVKYTRPVYSTSFPAWQLHIIVITKRYMITSRGRHANDALAPFLFLVYFFPIVSLLASPSSVSFNAYDNLTCTFFSVNFFIIHSDAISPRFIYLFLFLVKLFPHFVRFCRCLSSSLSLFFPLGIGEIIFPTRTNPRAYSNH